MLYLVRRPVAVIMTFLGFLILGIVMYSVLPVSLLPDIDIPKITVQVSGAGLSAQEIENTAVSRLRQRLLQVGGLESVTSRVCDGSGVVDMKFKFGTSIDYAYIEVNEKIDAAMNSLPSGFKRPVAVKTGASDIPAFYLEISLKDGVDNSRFLEMSNAVENIIRNRIEQLPQVAMADITGIPGSCITIRPDIDKLRSLSVDIQDIVSAVNNNNIQASSMKVMDGVYEYSIRVSSLLADISDVENIFLRVGERIFKLKDLCEISFETLTEQGMALSGGKRIISVAVIKQAEEGMDALRDKISMLTSEFATQFPDYDFKISRNQTELLDYTISNLKQNLVLGFILIIIVTLWFMGGFRVSAVIGITMIFSVVITFVPFYLFGYSLNTVSLSGLILVVGMMIDNALIVSENIMQWQTSGKTLSVSCAGGASELITPLLSSSLTTIAVFLPLVFLSGMAGAVFSDQAFAITAGLVVSYFTGIILLPVVYRVAFVPTVKKGKFKIKQQQKFFEVYNSLYSKLMNHKKLLLIISLVMPLFCYILFNVMKVSKMPQTKGLELTAKISWNEEITAQDNCNRTNNLLQQFASQVSEYSAYVGIKDFIADISVPLTESETEIYWKTSSEDSVDILKQKVTEYMTQNYPKAEITFAPAMNVFEMIFDSSEPDITVMMSFQNDREPSSAEIAALEKKVKKISPETLSSSLTFNIVRRIIANRETMAFYGVSLSALTNLLKMNIVGSDVTELHTYGSNIPVKLKINDTLEVEKFISEKFIPNNRGKLIPLRSFLKMESAVELKNITAGKNGTYIPVSFYGVSDAEKLMKDVNTELKSDDYLDVNFSGSYFGSQTLTKELAVVLAVSVLLMYFIMCAQFESFLQPLIVLLEIPVDTAFAMLVLWIFGYSLNLMSGIGIVVSCGIIINDSILKLDTINTLRRSGMPLLEAVHTAGIRRLKAIVMTTLTTVGAMLPVLFFSDMGSQIQQPLAVAMIAAMIIGVLVSLYVVPAVYILIEQRKHLEK